MEKPMYKNCQCVLGEKFKINSRLTYVYGKLEPLHPYRGVSVQHSRKLIYIKLKTSIGMVYSM